MKKVSVIIPIYGVERYVGRCVDSLMRQTLDEVEYIFVDDCTPDKSIEVVEEVLVNYPERQGQVTILHHEVNKGLPAARNTGMTVATGEYIFHCDSDDFVEPTLLEDMYRAAKEHEADYVWCDWFLSYENSERYMKMPSYSSADEALRGMLAGEMKYNVWNKLVKRNLYVDNGIEFPAGHSMGEDMTMIRVLAHSTSIACVNKALYHYVKTNSDAMTNHLKEQALNDIKHNVDATVLALKSASNDYADELEWFKLSVKLPFLISQDKKMYQLWDSWYKEANGYIWSVKNMAFRTKFLQQMAAWRQWWFVALYYEIVYKIIYRKLYK